MSLCRNMCAANLLHITRRTSYSSQQQTRTRAVYYAQFGCCSGYQQNGALQECIGMINSLLLHVSLLLWWLYVCDHLCTMVQLLFEVMCLICTYAITLLKLYLLQFLCYELRVHAEQLAYVLDHKLTDNWNASYNLCWFVMTGICQPLGMHSLQHLMQQIQP